MATDGTIYRDTWSKELPEGAEIFLLPDLAEASSIEVSRRLLLPERPLAFGHRQTGELLDNGQAIGHALCLTDAALSPQRRLRIHLQRFFRLILLAKDIPLHRQRPADPDRVD